MTHERNGITLESEAKLKLGEIMDLTNGGYRSRALEKAKELLGQQSTYRELSGIEIENMLSSMPSDDVALLRGVMIDLIRSKTDREGKAIITTRSFDTYGMSKEKKVQFQFHPKIFVEQNGSVVILAREDNETHYRAQGLSIIGSL